MFFRFARPSWRWFVLLAAVLTYFIFFPEDLATLLGPIQPLANAAHGALYVTQAVSPWLYGVVAVALACWTVVRVWGGPARPV